jgi:hypothetical protein
LNGLSDSDTFVKLTVKVTDKHCSETHQRKTSKKYQGGLKPTEKNHCVGQGREGVCTHLCACGREGRSCLHRLLSEAVDISVMAGMRPFRGGGVLFPANVCFVSNPCHQAMYVLSPVWCDPG